MANTMADDSQWRVLTGQLVALAHLIDVQLERTKPQPPPLELTGAFLEAAGVTLERYEAVITRIGQSSASQLSGATIESLRNAVFQLRSAGATLADLAPALDPHGRGRGTW